MALLTELFLILAGYSSAISQVDRLHPAEVEVIERATRFGKIVHAVDETTTAYLDNPVCRVLKRDVFFKYLEALAELESTVITKLLALKAETPNLSLENSLLFTAEILGETVDKWSQIFEFSAEVLARIDDHAQPSLTEWISTFILKNASYPIVSNVGHQILKELDIQWVDELTRVVAEGEKCPPKLLLHQQAPEPSLVEDICQAMYQLHTASSTNVSLLQDVIDLVEENDALLDKSIEVPINSLQCTRVLKTAQQNISVVVKRHFLNSPEVSAMLKLLRQVVLMGSSSFANNLIDSHGDTEKALDAYFDIDKELDSSSISHGLKLLSTSQVSGESIIPIKIRLNRSLEFLFNENQCAIYETLYGWLAKLVTSNGSIGIGNGSVAHAYKLFFNSLWSYYQECIDTAFARFNHILKDEGGLNVRAEQDQILKTLVEGLILNSREYRNLLQTAMDSCMSDNLDPLMDLVAFFTNCSVNHTLDLRPFVRVE